MLVTLYPLRSTLARARLRRPCSETVAIFFRSYSLLRDPGFKDTSPSSSKPSAPRQTYRESDEGYLSFTKSSLYMLTLPLPSPTTLPSSRISPGAEGNCSIKEGNANGTGTAWEELVEKGEHPFVTEDTDGEKKNTAPHSAVFLLHPGQPLGYIADLIRAEGTQANARKHIEAEQCHSERKLKPITPEELPIIFHTSMRHDQRWSSATGIGDFLREAARMGSFTITIGPRNVRVNVPTFEERTRFLRAALHQKTKRIEELTRVKDECDRIARRTTQRYAFGGAGVMSCWWLTVGILTFKTDLGWDVMEPITYLTGFGTAIVGYLWFLWHNREVSYRTVLTETTSRRQQKLYGERGFDIESYQELITEVKGLRRAIKRVAWDYGLEWDQGDTKRGQCVGRALEVVRREEECDRRKRRREDEEDKEEDGAFADIDDDGDGRPDRSS